MVENLFDALVETAVWAKGHLVPWLGARWTHHGGCRHLHRNHIWGRHSWSAALFTAASIAGSVAMFLLPDPRLVDRLPRAPLPSLAIFSRSCGSSHSSRAHPAAPGGHRRGVFIWITAGAWLENWLSAEWRKCCFPFENSDNGIHCPWHLYFAAHANPGPRCGLMRAISV